MWRVSSFSHFASPPRLRARTRSSRRPAAACPAPRRAAASISLNIDRRLLPRPSNSRQCTCRHRGAGVPAVHRLLHLLGHRHRDVGGIAGQNSRDRKGATWITSGCWFSGKEGIVEELHGGSRWGSGWVSGPSRRVASSVTVIVRGGLASRDNRDIDFCQIGTGREPHFHGVRNQRRRQPSPVSPDHQRHRAHADRSGSFSPRLHADHRDRPPPAPSGRGVSLTTAGQHVGSLTGPASEAAAERSHCSGGCRPGRAGAVVGQADQQRRRRARQRASRRATISDDAMATSCRSSRRHPAPPAATSWIVAHVDAPARVRPVVVGHRATMPSAKRSRRPPVIAGCAALLEAGRLGRRVDQDVDRAERSAAANIASTAARSDTSAPQRLGISAPVSHGMPRRARRRDVATTILRPRRPSPGSRRRGRARRRSRARPPARRVRRSLGAGSSFVSDPLVRCAATPRGASATRGPRAASRIEQRTRDDGRRCRQRVGQRVAQIQRAPFGR